MNKVTLLRSFLLVLVASLAFTASPARLCAETLTETKIRLMAEALRARDAGELDEARRVAAELKALVPNDVNVQRLAREIDGLVAARAAAPANSPAPAMVEVHIPAPETAKAVPRPAPVAPAAAPAAINDEAALEAEAEALAKSETQRIERLVAAAKQEKQRAHKLAASGRYDEALATIAAALASLPVNPVTQPVVAGLEEEKTAIEEKKTAATARAVAEAEKLARQEAEAAAKREAAEAKAAEQAARKVAAAEAKRVAAAEKEAKAAGPTEADQAELATFKQDRAEIAQLIAKGRSQYLAGDADGAQETFRAVEARSPDNAEAKGFLVRIAQEKAAVGALNREKTRAELIEDVTKSWQRPGIFQERSHGTALAAAAAPLAKKLNEIVLPAVSFTRAEIGQVVAALSAISEEFDNTGSAPKGVNLVLLDPTNKAPTVTITLRNTSLKRVLDFVTESIGYQYEVQADAVVIRPGGETTTLDTAFFPVARATVLRMTGIGGVATGTTGGKSDPFSSAGASNDGAGASNSGEGAAMKAFLQQAGVNFEAVPGSSLAYDGSALIVTQTARNIDRIRNILNRYNDVRQVEIEAKFIEVQEGSLDELGVQWSLSRRGIAQIDPTTGAPVLDSNGRQVYTPQEVYTSSNRSLADAFTSSSNTQALTVTGATTTTTSGTTTTTTTASDLSLAVNPPSLPGSASLASSATPLATITGFVGEFNVGAVVRALSQKQGTDLLSAPKVTVLSGNPANITVAQEMRYPESYGQIQSQVGTGSSSGGGSAGVSITAGTPQEFRMRNVGVELHVTPTVEEDDYSISLDLNPRVTEFDGFIEYGGPSIAISNGTTVTVPSGFYQPIFSLRQITTKVTIWDGATLVMGGLTREEVKKVSDKVPILGDLPLIGRAFRSKGESSQKRNLLIFVTANLVSPGGSPKKQNLRSVPASTLFQNPTIVTPASAESRTRSDK